MNSYDSESRRILQHFSRSTRFAHLCTAQISKFQLKIVHKFLLEWNENFIPSEENLMKFVIFLLNFDEHLSEFREELQKITNSLDM